LNQQIDVRAILPMVQAPTLVMQTREDAIVAVERGRWVAEHDQNGHFLVLDGGAHWPWGSTGRTPADALAEFFAGTADAMSSSLAGRNLNLTRDMLSPRQIRTPAGCVCARMAFTRSADPEHSDAA